MCAHPLCCQASRRVRILVGRQAEGQQGVRVNKQAVEWASEEGAGEQAGGGGRRAGEQVLAWPLIQDAAQWSQTAKPGHASCGFCWDWFFPPFQRHYTKPVQFCM